MHQPTTIEVTPYDATYWRSHPDIVRLLLDDTQPPEGTTRTIHIWVEDSAIYALGDPREQGPAPPARDPDLSLFSESTPPLPAFFARFPHIEYLDLSVDQIGDEDAPRGSWSANIWLVSNG